MDVDTATGMEATPATGARNSRIVANPCGGEGRHGEARGRRAGFGRNPQAGEMARGTGPGFGLWRAEDREGQIKRLEERQRDLEQRAADMADLIRRLQQEPGSGESPAAG